MLSFDAESKIFCGGKLPQLFSDHATVGQVLFYKCLQNPEKVIQICADDGAELTCARVSEMMLRIAAHVTRLGLKFGDVVGICCGNSTHVAPAVFGCVLAGLPLSPVDTSLDVDAIIDIYKQTNPKLMLCDGNQIEKIQQALKGLAVDIPIVSLTERVEGFPNILDMLGDIECDDLVCRSFGVRSEKACIAILPSSGSTGTPKLTRVSHAQMLEPLYAFYGLTDGTLLLNYFTMFWISGICTMIHSVLNQHTRLITGEKYSPKKCVDLVEKFKVTQVQLTPADVTLLLEYLKTETADLSSVRILSAGGWFMSEHAIRAIESKLPNGRVMLLYGMTEVCGIITRGAIDEDAPTTSSVGRICINTQAKILMEDGSLGGIGDVGEILIKRRFNIIDYLNNEEQTKALIDDDGWVHTGDMGYFDERLNFYIVGRKKFIIRCCNRQVFPTEIEDVISQLPGVAQVCVVAIPDSDAYEAPCAVIVGTPQISVNKQKVYDAVARLEDYKQLKSGVFFVDKLPLTTTGKLQRNSIEKLALKLSGKG